MIPVLDTILNDSAFSSKWSESLETLRATEVVYSVSVYGLLRILPSILQTHDLGTFTFTLNNGVTPNLSAPFKESDNNEPGRLVITKTTKDYFIFDHGFVAYLKGQKELPTTGIRLYFISAPFATQGARFFPFGFAAPAPAMVSLYDEPIKHVKPVGSDAAKYFPSHLESWVTEDSTVAPGFPDSWKSVAGFKLLATICSEFTVEADNLVFEFKGDMRKTLRLPTADTTIIVQLYPCLNGAAEWMYQLKRDIDTKLFFFQQYLCRGLSEDLAASYTALELMRIFAAALDNARLNYDYYLKSQSKDFQKNLTDLTKSLQDYQTKIKQNISDLSSGLWKDVTTVIGFLVLNFAIKEDNFIERYFFLIAMALCVYVAISFVVTSLSGFGYYYDAKSSLKQSRDRLYSYLNDVDYNILAEKPIKTSFRRYQGIWWGVLVAYLLVIGFVLYLVPDIRDYRAKEKPKQTQVSPPLNKDSTKGLPAAHLTGG